MTLEILSETACMLLDDSQQGASRVIRRIWLYTVIAISIGAVAISIVGGVAGYLDVPGDTKLVFIWATILVIGITAMAGALALLAAIIQKLGSPRGRGTGNTNVHPD
jgi:hypothetical protein